MTTSLKWHSPGHAEGLFICLDGPDGAGKSTQAARLAEFLRGQGHEVLAVRDPGGTALGDRLRSLLLDRDSVESCLKSEMLMFMASRAQLLAERVRPALESGKIVVADRYLLSTVVYQGYAGGLDPAEIWRVGHAATSGLVPSLTLVLDVSREVALSRMNRSRDRIESRPETYQEAVRAGFRTGMADFPGPIRRIDANLASDAVFEQILTEVRHVMAEHTRA
ncbi:MAG: dTMP kinase [bacterium]